MWSSLTFGICKALPPKSPPLKKNKKITPKKIWEPPAWCGGPCTRRKLPSANVAFSAAYELQDALMLKPKVAGSLTRQFSQGTLYGGLELSPFVHLLHFLQTFGTANASTQVGDNLVRTDR